MNTTPSETERNYTLREALFRATVMILVLTTTHSLVMWLHPFGRHEIFLTMALGTIVFGVVMRLLMPLFNVKTKRLLELFKL